MKNKKFAIKRLAQKIAKNTQNTDRVNVLIRVMMIQNTIAMI